MIKYIVRFSEDEWSSLMGLIDKGNVDEAFSCSSRTVFNARQHFVELGLEAALERKTREHPPRARILDGDGEAQLVRIACFQP